MMIKLKTLKISLLIFFVLLGFENFAPTKAFAGNDMTCVYNSDGSIDVAGIGSITAIDGTTTATTAFSTSNGSGQQNCGLTPVSSTFTVEQVALCTAAPVRATTSSAVDLSNCFTVFSGSASVTLGSVGDSAVINSGSVVPPPAGVFTHAYLKITNSFQLRAWAYLDEAVLYTGSSDLTSAGAYCYTITVSGANDAFNNAKCDNTTTNSSSAGTSTLYFNCFEGTCPTDTSLDDTAGYYTGSVNNITGASGATMYIDLVQTSGLRGGYASCNNGGCPAVDVIEELGTSVGSTSLVPTGLEVSFLFSQGALIYDDNAAPSISFRQGPMQFIFIPTYN